MKYKATEHRTREMHYYSTLEGAIKSKHSSGALISERRHERDVWVDLGVVLDGVFCTGRHYVDAWAVSHIRPTTVPRNPDLLPQGILENGVVSHAARSCGLTNVYGQLIGMNCLRRGPGDHEVLGLAYHDPEAMSEWVLTDYGEIVLKIAMEIYENLRVKTART